MKKTVHIFLLLGALVLLGSCKKLVEDRKRDLLVQAMANGQWHIETFQEGSATITDQFAGYNFEFHDNGTISAIKATIYTAGTWSSDLQNYSITSDFPSAPDPLKKLNGTWRITDSQTGFVVAELSVSQNKTILHLRKNQ